MELWRAPWDAVLVAGVAEQLVVGYGIEISEVWGGKDLLSDGIKQICYQYRSLLMRSPLLWSVTKNGKADGTRQVQTGPNFGKDTISS